jgi:hypothetical protein
VGILASGASAVHGVFALVFVPLMLLPDIEGYEGILELDPRRRAQFALGPQPSELRRQVIQMRDLCDEVIADGGKDSGWFLHGDRKFTAAHLRDESDRLGDHKLRELARAAAQAWDSTFAAAPPPRPARAYNLNRPDMYRDEDLAHDSRRARATDGADVAKVQCGLVIARLNELEARGI